MPTIEVGTGLITMEPDFAHFRAGVERGVGQSFSALGIGAQQAGLALAPLSIAAGAALTGATSLAIGYEASFTQIEALVGESTEALEELKQSTLDLAKETGKGPKELAEALFFVESAGLRGAAAADTLAIAARGAAVGLGETATVADALTSATNAYAQSGLTAAAAGDVLVASVREGKLQADTLAGALGRVIPIAAAAGVSFDQVGAALAATTRIGLNAQEAATAIRQIMITLINPTDEARDALARYGLSAAGLARQLRQEGLLSTLRTLKDTFGDNNEALQEVFGNVRALTGVLALVGENAGQTQDIFDALGASTGDLDTAFAKIQDDSAFQLSVAMAKLQVAGIALGESLVPVLVQLAEIGGTLAEVFAKLPNPIQETVGKLLALVAILSPMLLLAGGVLRAAAAIQFLKAQHLQAAAAAGEQAAAEVALTGALNGVAVSSARATAATAARGGRLTGGALGIGSRLATGAAVVFAADFAASAVQSIENEEDSIGDAIVDTLAGAARGAAIGGTIASVLPIGISTLAGAAVGGAIGGAISLFSTLTESTGEAVANGISVGIDSGIDRGLGSISSFIDNRAIELGKQAGIATGLAIAFGVEESAPPALTKVFSDILNDFAKEVDDASSQFDFGAVPSFFEAMFEKDEDFKKRTLEQIVATFTENADAIAAIEDGIGTLARAGLVGLAGQLADAPKDAETAATVATFVAGLLNDPAVLVGVEQRISGFGDPFAQLLLNSIESGTLVLPSGFGDDLVTSATERLAAAAIELAPVWGIAWATATQDATLLESIRQASLELALAAGDFPISDEDLRAVVQESLADVNIDQIILTELLGEVDPDLVLDPGIIEILSPDFKLEDDPSLGPLIQDFAGFLGIDAEVISAQVLDEVRAAILGLSTITPEEYEELTAGVAEKTSIALQENLVSVLSDADLTDPQAIKDALVGFVASAGQSIAEADVAEAFKGFDSVVANTLGASLGAAIQEQGIGEEIAAFLGTDLNAISAEVWTGLFDPASKSMTEGISAAIASVFPSGITEPMLADFATSAASIASALGIEGGSSSIYFDIGVAIINGINAGLQSSGIFQIQVPGVTFGGVDLPGTGGGVVFNTYNPTSEPTEASIQDDLATATTVTSGNSRFP
jgi:TP901 family phage tail tape measure protein